MITLESLEEMFANIKVKTKWNVNDALLWGYFFTDHDPRKFGPLRKHLEGLDYRFVTILQPEDAPEDAEDKGIYFLHVERVEHHTPQSLHKRNQQFYRLAEQFGVETYDGMDVGEVGK